MPLALMAIGVPGTGKTTVLKPIAAQYGLSYINRDDIREEILGDARDQSANRAVWEEANRRTLAALASGKGVVLDSTFVDAWKRRDMVSLLHEAGASPIVAVVSTVPLATALERNAARDRVVPEEVIHDMHRKLTDSPPALDEGFDLLLTLEELEERLATILPR